MAAIEERPLVLVLHSDGCAGADERDTLVQVETVAAALVRLGYRVETLVFDADLARFARRVHELSPALVFNLVESFAGGGRLTYLAPAMLDAMRIPFCGCGASALMVTGDKLLAKRVMLGAGVPTPRWIEGPVSTWPARRGERMIVKPVCEDASIGIDEGAVVGSTGALNARLQERRATLGGAWFAEHYVEGREFNVSLVAESGGVRVLPVAEICFVDFPPLAPRIVDYAAKWQPESFAYRHTPRRFDFSARDGPVLASIAELARRCWRLFGLAGYARVDVRVDAEGAPWVLEVNANPCLSPDAGFAAAAAREGLDFDAVIGRIVDDARGATVKAAA